MSWHQNLLTNVLKIPFDELLMCQGSYRNWAIKFNDFSMTFSWPIKIFHDSEMLKTQPFGGIFFLGD